MIEYSKLNLWLADADVIVNTTNCIGPMGAGIAKVFRDSFPHMAQIYQGYCKGGVIQVGTLLVYHLDKVRIANVPTKRHYMHPCRVEDVEASLRTLARYVRKHGLTVAMPKVGCGTGKLDWSQDVEPIVARLFEDIDVTISVGRLDPLHWDKPSRSVAKLWEIVEPDLKTYTIRNVRDVE